MKIFPMQCADKYCNAWRVRSLRNSNAGADQENFQRGRGLRREILKKKSLLIHVSTRVHIKTRQTCNSFSLLPFQEDCLLFFALFYYSLLFSKFDRGGGCNPCNPPPPLDSPLNFI